MFIITRSKAAMDPDGKPKGPPRTHFAVTVAPGGHVTKWTAAAAEAGRFDEATVERVNAHYEAKAKLGHPVGKFAAKKAGDAPPAAPDGPKPPPPAPPDGGEKDKK